MARPMQGDVEDLLRDAAKVAPLALVADDPRLKSYGPQFATMLLTAREEIALLRAALHHATVPNPFPMEGVEK